KVALGPWLERKQEPASPFADLKLLKPEDREDVKSVPPPEGAIVLFDGKNLDSWTMLDGKPATWLGREGGILVARDSNLQSKRNFDGRFRLHVEFRVPWEPEKKGQGRANSGVFLQGHYELQILDSYGRSPAPNECGALYSLAAPLTNACKAPT